MAFVVLVFFSCIFLQAFSAVNAQSGGNITIGASLTAAENSPSWLSPSGEFAFGFHPLENNRDLFLLSIWYDKIPEKTIVWWASGDSSPTAPRASKVELTANSGLVLRNPQGDELWSSGPIIGTVTYGSMNDSGNFVLFNSNSMKAWESFGNPTDTMLPTQTLERGWLLSSRQSEKNFSKGRFRIQLISDGNLVLTTINLPTDHANEPYYQTQTGDDATNTSSTGHQVVFNQSGYLYLQLMNDQRFPLTRRVETSASSFYYRATMDFDGVFIQYQHPKNSSGNEGWTAFWSLPDNICTASFVSTGSGTCGFNSVCRLNGERRPICQCPRGYSLLDPNDPYGSCKPNFTQTCEDDELGRSPEDLYDYEELTNTDWPTSDYELLTPFTEEGCRRSCLHDCMCAVAIFRAGDMCWKKKLPLSNGKVDMNINGKALIKIRKGKVPPNPYDRENQRKKNRENLILVGSVLLGGSVFFNFILAGAICLCFYFVYSKKHKPIPRNETVAETNLLCFSFKELQEATNGFKEELGKGAFGVVYKGAFSQIGSSSTILVAVKKLKSLMHEHDGEKEFKTELNVIGQTHHKNLVRLIGFCDDGLQRLLVYEFMSHGTLASFLFGELKPSWSLRTQIALGIARGLLYLHEECSTQIIHCDIKPQNILLDDYFNARISDFGLAKLLLLNQSKTHTAIRGTKGYVAPEWFRNLPITAKVDVYSFGVLLLEIICCRRSVDMEMNESEAILTDWAYDCYCEGVVDALVEFDKEALNELKKVERFVMVAIWCIQEDPSLRPNMRKVAHMLEGVVEVLVPPCPCPFNATN